MYVQLQLSAQDVTELQRKQDLRAANVHSSSTQASVPGRPPPRFSPQRPRAHFNSQDRGCLSEKATQTQTCWDPSRSSHSSPGQASASACPRHSRSQHRGCSPSRSSAETAVEQVGLLSSFRCDNTQFTFLCIVSLLLAV